MKGTGRYKYKGKSRKAYKASKVAPGVKSYVDKKIKNLEECKISSYTFGPTNILGYNGSAGSLTTFEIVQATQMAQGVGQGNRVGNTVSPAGLKLRGFITLNGTTITGIVNAYFRVIVLRLRESIATTQFTYSNLFQFGNNVVAPSGTLLDMMRPVNKDLYKVYHDKIVNIGASDAVNATIAGNQTASSVMFKMDLKKTLPKTMRYNDSSLVSTNYACYLVIVNCNANGQIISAPQIAAFSSSWEADFYYRDA